MISVVERVFAIYLERTRMIENNKDKMKGIITSCTLGGSLEWYSFAIYGFLSTIMGANFFAFSDPFQQAIAALGAFAVGLLSRPIGALIFGYISSAYSQQLSFSISVYMMAIATFLIGLLPTYADIGGMSTALLIVLRIFQGLSLGGGFTGTMVFLFENSPKEKRNTYTIISSFGLIIAFILCAITSTVMSIIFSEKELTEYAWRLPFLISILGIFAANYINKKLAAAQGNSEKSEAPKDGLFKEVFVKNLKTFLTVIIGDVFTGCGFFIIAIFFTTYFETFLHVGKQATAISQIFAMSIFSVTVMAGGMLCDKFDRKKLMIGACVALSIFAYPLFCLPKLLGIYGAVICQIIVIALFSVHHAGFPALMCESFAPNIRPIAVASSHNLAMAMFGAYSPSLAANLIQSTGDLAAPGYLLIGASILSIIGVSLLFRQLANK